MPDRYEYLAHLITRYLRQELTVEERTELEAWLAERPENQRFIGELEDTRHLQQKLQVFHAVDRERLWVLTQSKLSEAGYGSAARPMRRIGKWVPYAAALLLGVVATAWFFFNKQPASEPLIINQQVADIPPGGNRATLTLAGGRTITLDEARDGIVIGSDEITYNDGNPLIDVEGNAKGLGEQTLLALSTPRGGTYQITLPDGTQVWLNAESRLKYPPRFVDGERIVELTGEAYFSVAKDASRPFKVVSAGQEVEVLGTEFNVSAYPDDPEARTTLVAGSVRVSLENQPTFLVLVPGEQSYVSNGNVLTKSHVNVKKELAWKSGSFYFDTTSFQDLLRQVGRWYDVDVIYEGVVPKETFSGIMSRNVTLKTLLEFLNESAVNITLEGRTLVVRPEVTQQ